MSRIRGFVHRLRVLVDPDSYAREVEREIRFHLDREAMQRRGVGLDAQDADYAARRQFGNVTYVREEVRRMSGMDWIDRIRQNVGYAVRGLRQSPGFTTAVVLTLGLGLGVNAAMFTFLDSVFVKAPAGVDAPREVRRIYASVVRPASIVGLREASSRLILPGLWYRQVREIRRADSSIALGLFKDQNDSVQVKVDQSSYSAQQGIADANYFRVLGVRPQLGRFFERDEDDIANPAAVAIISHAMWQRVFDGHQRVVGSTFLVKYRPITVIGVAPPGFTGIDLDKTDYWLPAGNYAKGLVRGVPWYDTYAARFAAVARFPQATAEHRFLQLATQVAASTRPAMSGDSIGDVLGGPIQASLGPVPQGKEVAISVRLGGVGLIILLITLANVANLLLVRTTRREREIAIRRALGVTRARLFEQLITESVLLAILGAAFALLLSIWVGTALRALLLPAVHWPTGVLDLRVVAFASLGALLAGIAVGLVPALNVWRPDLLSSLRAGANNTGYRRSHLRAGLLIAQAAMSVVLLVGSGLFVRSLRNVQRINVGFDLSRTHYVRVVADTGSLTRDMAAILPDLLPRVASIPGVEGVATAQDVPMLNERRIGVALPGRDSVPQVFGSAWTVRKSVSPGYFRVIGQRVTAGREFVAGDPPSLLVSKEMAEAFWPGESPLGKCIILGRKGSPCIPVIGVTVTTNRFRIMNEERVGQLYFNGDTLPAVLLRVAPERRAQVGALVSAEVKRLLPRAMVVQVRSMEETLEGQLRPWRLGATLFTAMGVLALIVAAIGVYSVIAYATAQRTSEMGIRIALGAKLTDIARLVVSDGLRTVAIGIVVGVGLALGAGSLVAPLLYDVSHRDPMIMASSAMTLALIGFAACVIPALRAARIDPVSALRTD